MGAIVLFVGVPLSTWAKSLSRRGVTWSRWAFAVLLAGAAAAFAFGTYAGFANLAAGTDPVKLRPDAVGASLGAARMIAGITIALAASFLAIAEVIARRRMRA